MKKLFSRFTALELFIGGSVIILVFLFILLIYGVLLYQDIQESKQAGQLEAQKTAIEQSELDEAYRVSSYHGNQKFFVVEGITAEEDEAVVFVPDEKEKIQLFIKNELFSPEEILSKWKDQCDTCQLVDYTWAIKNERPLLEVTFISKSDRYVFEYFDLQTGETHERVPPKQSQY